MCGGYGGQYHSVVSSKATKQTVTNHRKSVPPGMSDILGTPFAGPHSYNLGGKCVQHFFGGISENFDFDPNISGTDQAIDNEKRHNNNNIIIIGTTMFMVLSS